MPLRLIIFDWDGTLMDSAAKIVTAVRAAYGAAGLPRPSPAAIENIIGLSLSDAFRHISPGLTAAKYTELADQYRRCYATAAIDSQLFPGVKSTLSALGAQGYDFAVATGKSRAGLARAISETALEGVFTATRSADHSAPKPAPDMILEILDELALTPAEALLIGDTEFDLAMAQEANVQRAAVSYGAHARERLLAYDPLFVLDEFSELPNQLQRHVAGLQQ